MNEEQALKTIKKICESNEYIEICGFLGYDRSLDKYVVSQQDNISEDPSKYFMIDPIDYLLFKDKCEMVAVYHSHTEGSEQPSKFDIKMAESCCDPFLIYSLETKKIHIYEPKNMDLDVSILNRVKDCNDQN
jgi:proteasome lid subunit RPN8/RPN11